MIAGSSPATFAIHIWPEQSRQPPIIQRTYRMAKGRKQSVWHLTRGAKTRGAAMSDQQKPEQDDKGRFVTGNIGGGRPKGARNKLGEAFLEALNDDFQQHGVAAIQVVRAEKPDQYLKVIASLLPKDHNININNADDLSDAELAERIRALATQLAPFLPGGTGSADEATGGTESAILTPRVH